MNATLFDACERPPLAERLTPLLRSWADRGVYFGASSWKYPRWVGSIYSPNRYLTRNKFSKAKFESTCLSEYAETFPVVGGDFSFYQFPSPEIWANQFAGAPAGFGFGLKVPEEVTVLRWPGHARYGKRAGLQNEHFLDAELFKEAFTTALEPHRDKVAVMIFEFGKFAKKDFSDPEIFFGRLEGFLGSLPRE